MVEVPNYAAAFHDLSVSAPASDVTLPDGSTQDKV